MAISRANMGKEMGNPFGKKAKGKGKGKDKKPGFVPFGKKPAKK